MNLPPDDSAAQLRSCQIIAVAMGVGVALFAAIAAFLGPLGQPMAALAYGLDPIALAAIFVSASSLPLLFLLPPRIVEGAKSGDPQRRIEAFRLSKILAAALCEGPAMLWCVALLLTGNTWFLVPIVLLLALMGTQIATRDSFEAATGLRVREPL